MWVGGERRTRRSERRTRRRQSPVLVVVVVVVVVHVPVFFCVRGCTHRMSCGRGLKVKVIIPTLGSHGFEEYKINKRKPPNLA